MLLSFEFTNSSSFRDPQDLNLARPARTTKENAQHWVDSSWDHEFSSVTAIFGANAAGKTGIVRSMSEAVTNATQLDGTVSATPFRLSDSAISKPTVFEIRFRTSSLGDSNSLDEFHYKHEIIHSGLVVYEELRVHVNGMGRSKRVFKREINLSHKDSAKYDYSWGADYKGEKAFPVRLTAPNQLFLAQTRHVEDNALAGVLNWLTEDIKFYTAADYETDFRRIKQRLYDDRELLDNVRQHIGQADLGIVDLKISERSDEQVLSFRKALEQSDGMSKRAIDAAIEEFRLEVIFTHRGDDGDRDFGEYSESDGTRAMLSFASIAIEALADGKTIVIDEIDTSLHPLLVREFVRQFTTPETNPNQAQLIFTTHDATLLHNPAWLDPVLDRDQIWLVEKGRDGASSLYSVAEFPVRNDENIFRKYLGGQYGAIPRPSIAMITE